MPRNPVERNNVDWEDRYGTTISGNLPQYRDPATSAGVECLEDILYASSPVLSGATNLEYIQTIFPWVTFRDFHYFSFRCPYSTESSTHYVRDTNRQSETYWQMISVSSEAVSHTTTDGLMIRYSRGSKHGWLCVDPICPYYKGTATTISGIGNVAGIPYFKI